MFNCQKYNQIKEYIVENSQNTEIIAVSKNHPKESVIQAISCGVTDFAENRVQEAENKFQNLLEKQKNLTLHLTGPLQTNKVKQALKLFDFFHVLDREKLALEFAKHTETIKTKKFFIQVNTGIEQTKSGIYPNMVKTFGDYCINKLKLNVIGLMCIPPIQENPKNHFQLLKSLGKDININKYSMGMSDDYKEAISQGSSFIRLGTVLFGSRN